jgi:hypothetical protein
LVKADQSHDVRTLFRLARTGGSGVRGPFSSNIYFFFQTLPGSPVQQEVAWSTVPSPTINPPTNYDPSIVGRPDALIDHVISITGNLLSAFFSKTAVQHYTLTPTP